jgi:lipoprotein-releasing system ATP-binding protein
MGSNNVLIEVQGLKKSFQSGSETLDVLKGIDFTIFSGEMMAICGASGVGKSTFLHILGTLEHPTEGKVLYEGTDIFSLDNVIMPHLIAGVSRRKCLANGRKRLAEVGLSGRADHKPGELSGGEQQRVAIARALCMKPKIVFADEPTGNLDTATGEAVHVLLQDLNRKEDVTFVLATHNEHLAKKSDRIVQMVDGKVYG